MQIVIIISKEYEGSSTVISGQKCELLWKLTLIISFYVKFTIWKRCKIKILILLLPYQQEKKYKVCKDFTIFRWTSLGNFMLFLTGVATLGSANYIFFMLQTICKRILLKSTIHLAIRPAQSKKIMIAPTLYSFDMVFVFYISI